MSLTLLYSCIMASKWTAFLPPLPIRNMAIKMIISVLFLSNTHLPCIKPYLTIKHIDSTSCPLLMTLHSFDKTAMVQAFRAYALHIVCSILPGQNDLFPQEVTSRLKTWYSTTMRSRFCITRSSVTRLLDAAIHLQTLASLLGSNPPVCKQEVPQCHESLTHPFDISCPMGSSMHIPRHKSKRGWMASNNSGTCQLYQQHETCMPAAPASWTLIK